MIPAQQQAGTTVPSSAAPYAVNPNSAASSLPQQTMLVQQAQQPVMGQPMVMMQQPVMQPLVQPFVQPMMMVQPQPMVAMQQQAVAPMMVAQPNPVMQAQVPVTSSPAPAMVMQAPVPVPTQVPVTPSPAPAPEPASPAPEIKTSASGGPPSLEKAKETAKAYMFRSGTGAYWKTTIDQLGDMGIGIRL
jgi:hypothetical protein